MTAKSNNVEIVESYINGLKNKDVSSVPFAADVKFKDPLTPMLNGPDAVKEFVAGLFPIINDVTIKQHVAEGEYVATVWEADTTMGLIPVFELFRITGGEIKEIIAYLDPRPITNPAT